MRVCFFDIDGTLIRTKGAGRTAFGRVFAEEFGVTALDGQVEFAGRSDRAIALEILQRHGHDPSPENWQRFCRVYVERLPTVLQENKGQVLPGVVELITQLQQLQPSSGIELGLLTGNMAAGAQAKLTHYGLWEHFAFGGYGDRHTDRCDIAHSAVAAARAHLHGQANGAAATHERLVVIGDTVHDIRCARAIGAYAVAVPTGASPLDELQSAEPDLAIETLHDAQPLVDWLLA